MNEEVRHFGLRKLSIGLASVLVGVSIFGASQTVKADTVADQTASIVTNNAKNNAALTQESDQKQAQAESIQQDSTSKTQETNDSKDLGAEKSVARAGSLQVIDNQSNTVNEKTAQHDTLGSGQKTHSFNLLKNSQSQKLVKKALTTNLIETASLPITNGGFDEATWGKLDVNNWRGSIQDGLYQLTGYTGDLSHIIIPNEADFEEAGKSTNGLQVGITCDTIRLFLSNQTQTIAVSKTNNEKVKAIGTDWSRAFSVDSTHSDLNKFDGSNLDVSNITDMSYMFFGNSISDLTSLKYWDTSKVTDMSYVFSYNPISDLRPLKYWDTSKVTDMSWMFSYNSISDLRPLANWDTSKVTSMNSMFASSSISDLRPLANWNVSSVTNTSGMFYNNSINDLKPLANWNVSNVIRMNEMFESNKVSDLRPLANWDTSKVTNMGWVFAQNPDLIDLKPIANWNIHGISLFNGDGKLNLTNINNTKLMKDFLKVPNVLRGATYITNNADLVKATINKDLSNLNLTNTATRTIVFNFPHATPETITQVINYKAIATVQVNFNSHAIVQTYPVKGSDWQLDDSKQNDAIIVNGQIHFKAVKIPHVNGYKARIVRDKINPAMLMVSFMAIPTENKPSNPIEEIPSKPSANPDKPFTKLDHKAVDVLNSNDSGWTTPNAQLATYTMEVPADDATIDLSDWVIAEPVYAQTRMQIHVSKRFKLSKKHLIKHLKHRKRVSKLFNKRFKLSKKHAIKHLKHRKQVVNSL